MASVRVFLTFALCLLPSALCFLPSALLQSQQRDLPAMAAPGTASISGQVITDEAVTRPVRRAIVSVTGSLPASRSVITDDDGRFVFKELPPGRFTVSVTKAAHLPAAYGATRPGRPGTPLALVRDQQSNITIKMARGAVLTGTLRDRDGAALPGVQVNALNPRAGGPSGNAVDPVMSATTDDRGVYRIYGLLPADYLITATLRLTGSGQIGARSVADMDAVLAELAQRGRNRQAIAGVAPTASRPSPPIAAPPTVAMAPTYFPGTPLPQDATRVRVGIGEVQSGLDFQVSPVAAANLEGTISGPVPSLAVVQISIVVAGQRGVSSMDSNPVLAVRPGADGQFRFSNVTPGHYTIMARANRNQAAPASRSPMQTGAVGPQSSSNATSADYLYAVADIDARGEDVTGIALALQPGSTFGGHIRFDATALTAPEDLTTVRISVSPPSGTGYLMSNDGTIIGNTFSAVAPAGVRADGSFAMSNIAPGTYVLRSLLPADLGQSWWLRSAVVQGRDLLDAPLEFIPGDNLTNAVLTFSDRHTELSGSLQTPAGLPATDYFVVVIPADRALWRAGPRRLQMTRPGSDGTFVIRDLPGGDYLIAALTDVEPGDLADSRFLEQLTSAAVRVTLADGERRTQDLRIAK